MTVYDLTQFIAEKMTVYPGTPQPVLEISASISKEGFLERRLTIFTHTGTHIDAPSHIFPHGKTLTDYPAAHFVGRACALDVSASGSVIKEDFLKLHRGEIENSRFVLLYTGWSRFWGREEYFTGFPVLSHQAATWLAGFDLKGVGIDAVSVDPSGAAELEVHKILLGRGICIIENLTGIFELIGSVFTFCCFPMKIESADGSPVRAVAFKE